MAQIDVLLSAGAAQALRELRDVTGGTTSSVVASALSDALMIRSGGRCENEFRVIRSGGTLGRHLRFPLAEQARGPLRGRLHAVAAEPRQGDPGVVSLSVALPAESLLALARLALAAGCTQPRIINQALLDERRIVQLALRGEGLFEGKGWNGRWFPSVLHQAAGAQGTPRPQLG